jgi:glucosamine--fructose-6-phosphate aminotransferase (isomerizing)
MTAPRTSQMRRDIERIPAIVAELLNGDPAPMRELAAAVRRARPAWAMIVARGTSDHAAVYGQYLLEAYAGLPTALASPSVTTVYGAPIGWRRGLLVAISQSGQSPDVVSVTAAARAGGAITVAVTNVPDSPLGAAARHVIPCEAGPELAVPATKTYTAQLAVLARLVASLVPESQLGDALPAVAPALESVLHRSDDWLARSVDGGRALLERMAAADRALIASRGFNLATALEIALKLKETSGLFAEAYSTADLMHGPLVLANPDVPLLVVRPDGRMGAAIDTALGAARARAVEPWIIGGLELTEGARTLRLEDGLPDALTPLVYALPGQLLAERVARARGMDPDAPLGLAKVTETL